MDDKKGATGKAKGGLARADALAPETRSAIAKKAANERWNPTTPRATHEGVLEFGDVQIPCFVLEDGRRVLTTRGIMRSLGRSWRGRKYSGTQLPVFLEAQNLKPFIDSDLDAVLTPLEFRTNRGGKAEGFTAEVLPAVCDVYLRAREQNVLTPQQETVAQKCEMLVRALSKVGIIALVDEATGYQDVRDRQALQALLDAYLRKELAAWAKRFPDEFYQQIYRLRGWTWKGRQTNPPQVVAYYTKDLVYARLAPHIIEELEVRNPAVGGRRLAKHHQWLSDDVGHPALAQHLHAVITLMRVATSWDHFMQMIEVAHPRKGDTLQLPLMSDFSSNELPLLPSLESSAESSTTI